MQDELKGPDLKAGIPASDLPDGGTLTIKNAGTADCVGNWTGTLGAFDPGTLSGVQGSSGLFGSCSFVGDVPLLSPIFNQMVVHSAWTCQGSGTLQPGATASVTGRITPAGAFNNSQFLAAYLLTFRRTGGIPGTNSLTSYGRERSASSFRR